MGMYGPPYVAAPFARRAHTSRPRRQPGRGDHPCGGRRTRARPAPTAQNARLVVVRKRRGTSMRRGSRSPYARTTRQSEGWGTGTTIATRWSGTFRVPGRPRSDHEVLMSARGTSPAPYSRGTPTCGWRPSGAPSTRLLHGSGRPTRSGRKPSGGRPQWSLHQWWFSNRPAGKRGPLSTSTGLVNCAQLMTVSHNLRTASYPGCGALAGPPNPLRSAGSGCLNRRSVSPNRNRVAEHMLCLESLCI